MGFRNESSIEALVSGLHSATGLFAYVDAVTLGAFRRDFGGFSGGEPRAVVAPRTAEEVAAVVRFAAERGVTVTCRGSGGSASGQSISAGGLVLDLTRMDRVIDVDADAGILDVEAGARLGAAANAAVLRGCFPPVLPLNLQLTVGGVLSAAGIGTTSFRWGTLANKVRELEVVTATGELLHASEDGARELFDAVRGGSGQFGVICRARLELERGTPQVHTAHLLYEDYGAWLADQAIARADPTCMHIEGYCWAAAKGTLARGGARRPYTHWLYGLHVAAAGQAPDLSRLRPHRVLCVDEDTTLGHAQRYGGRFEWMQRSGDWNALHPWAEYFLTPDVLERLLPHVLDLLPTWLGDGHRVMWIAREDLPPFLRVPDGSGAIGFFGILPTGVPRALERDAAAVFARVDELLLSAGAKRYISGWLGSTDDAYWERHFGSSLAPWLEAKRRFDPDGVFGSSLLLPRIKDASGARTRLRPIRGPKETSRGSPYSERPVRTRGVRRSTNQPK